MSITNSSRNVAEGTINMSMAGTPSAWSCRKLRWGVRPAQHVLGDGGLADLNTELEQLAVNPRRTPEQGWQGTSAGSICVFPCSRVVALQSCICRRSTRRPRTLTSIVRRRCAALPAADCPDSSCRSELVGQHLFPSVLDAIVLVKP